MTGATDYRSVSRLVMRQFRPGMRTNNFLAKADYERQIAQHRLSLLEFDGGLLLLTRQDGCLQLRFHLHNAAVLPELDAAQPIVCEVVQPPEDDSVTDCWLQKLGFAPLFRRVRLQHEASASLAPAAVDAARTADLAAIRRILHICFDQRTGCLPDEAELQAIVSEGRMLCVRNDTGSPVGLLHFRRARGGTELRHLAVLPQYRGRHLAQALFAQYMQATNGQKSLLWVREDNTPARNLYHKCGYQPDGWSAVVYEKG